MRALDRVASWLGYGKIPAQERAAFGRSFLAAIQSRLTQDWVTTNQSADAALKYDVKTMRDRARDLERSENYVRRYFKLLENNVLGANGVGLQMKIREAAKNAKGQFVERYDARANSIIEAAFYKWNRREFCDYCQNYSWPDLQRLALRSTARDGGVMFRKHYSQDNPFRFAIEPLEIDHLDVDFNTTPTQGTMVKMGVEYQGARVVAYHIKRAHPGEQFQYVASGVWRERVPAKEIIHLFMPERIGQSVGAPWVHSAVMGLRHLAKYSEAEVVAARSSAAKMGFLVPNSTAAPPGYTGATDSSGNKYMEVEPGSIEQLPFGYDFKAFDPTHPNSAFKDFVKAQLREISAGLGVSYTSLANDLEAVNFSSIRAGLLEEREEWKAIQRWFVERFVQPVFEEWLLMSLTAGAVTDGVLTLPVNKFDKFNAPEFKPRRWDWVDPISDMQASVLAVEKGFKSRRQIIAEAGGDVEDVFADIAADDDLAEQHGLDFSADAKNEANTTAAMPKGSNDTGKGVSVDNTKEVNT